MYNEQALKETSKYMTKLPESHKQGYVLLIWRKEINKVIDISELVGDIIHTTSLNDTPGKLTFFIQRDNNKVLDTVHNGDMVLFHYFDKNGIGVGIFRGYIFNIGIDATDVFKITAYDQTRYLKNEDSIIVENKTVSQLFEQICTENQFKFDIITPINFVTPDKIYHKKTLYSILRENITKAETDTWVKSGGKQGDKYMIRDNYGVLELRSINTLKTNVIIGQDSCLSSFQFETSIDKGTYNRFKLVKKVDVAGDLKKGKEVIKNTEIVAPEDDRFIKQWGVLQQVREVDEHMNKAQLTQYGNQLLKMYCRETKTLSLSALGILGMNAGVGFKFFVPNLGATLDMYILEATHKYSMDFHTMDLQVNANDVEVYWK